MSKESLEQLNRELVQHMEAAGDTPAIYYAPLKPDYWEAGGKKIAFCNLEAHDERRSAVGINPLTAEEQEGHQYESLFGWIYGGVNVIVRTALMNYALQKTLSGAEGFEAVTEELFSSLAQEFKNPMCDLGQEILAGMCRSVYFNLRLTLNQTGGTHKDTAAIYDFLRKDGGYYKEYQRKFIEAIDPDILIVGSKDGYNLINEILPDLDAPLQFDGGPARRGKMSVFSIWHLSGLGLPKGFNLNKYVAEKINFIKANA